MEEGKRVFLMVDDGSGAQGNYLEVTGVRIVTLENEATPRPCFVLLNIFDNQVSFWPIYSVPATASDYPKFKLISGQIIDGVMVFNT